MGTDKGSEKIFRVGTNTPTKELGSAIAHAIYDQTSVVIRSIGHGAAGQAVKGLAVAEALAAKQAVRMKTNFGFDTATMPDGKEVSLVLMRVTRD